MKVFNKYTPAPDGFFHAGDGMCKTISTGVNEFPSVPFTEAEQLANRDLIKQLFSPAARIVVCNDKKKD